MFKATLYKNLQILLHLIAYLSGVLEKESRGKNDQKHPSEAHTLNSPCFDLFVKKVTKIFILLGFIVKFNSFGMTAAFFLENNENRHLLAGLSDLSKWACLLVCQTGVMVVDRSRFSLTCGGLKFTDKEDFLRRCPLHDLILIWQDSFLQN